MSSFKTTFVKMVPELYLNIFCLTKFDTVKSH